MVKHSHHIIPRYMKNNIELLQDIGLSNINNQLNLTPKISVELHAAMHKDLFEHYHDQRDLLAWKMLSGQSLKGCTAMAGLHHSTETRQKMSIAAKKRGISKECRKKISASLKGRLPWNKGRTASPETIEKMKGKHPTLETRLKMSKSAKQVSQNRYHFEYKIIDPNGAITTTDNLKEFAKKNDLDCGQMYRVAAGKSPAHKKFKVIRSGYKN